MKTDTRRIDLPLPTIELPPELVEWAWPRPPFAALGQGVPRVEGAQPCRIETANGAAIEGLLQAFDPTCGVLSFRIQTQQAVEVPFSRIRRVTLTTPWELAQATPGLPYERVRAASLERDYRAELAGGMLQGRTLGSVANDAGWFLFEPDEAGQAVIQHFVPATACRSMTFGPTVEETAAERWAHTPEQLRAALAAQRHARVRRIGEALSDLGLVTPREMAQGVEAQRAQADQPLGELLVAKGVIDQNDLQTALAFKLGYPMVDVTRFPLDRETIERLPVPVIAKHRVLPLMQEEGRLVVAIATLRDVPELQRLSRELGLQLVPVLAPRGRLDIVLRGLAARLGTDVWAETVPEH